MKNLRRIVALYDTHIPDNIPLDGVIKFIKDFNPTHLILGGDFLHLESVRQLAKDRKMDVASAEFKNSVAGLNEDLFKAKNAAGEALIGFRIATLNFYKEIVIIIT